jgi:hypothetical protein
MKRIEATGERVMYIVYVILCMYVMYVGWIFILTGGNFVVTLYQFKKENRPPRSWRHQQHSTVAYTYTLLHGLIAPYITLRITFDAI